MTVSNEPVNVSKDIVEVNFDYESEDGKVSLGTIVSMDVVKIAYGAVQGLFTLRLD